MPPDPQAVQVFNAMLADRCFLALANKAHATEGREAMTEPSGFDYDKARAWRHAHLDTLTPADGDPRDKTTAPRPFAAEGARVALVTCEQCGAALLLDPDDEFDVIELHQAWHVEDPHAS